MAAALRVIETEPTPARRALQSHLEAVQRVNAEAVRLSNSAQDLRSRASLEAVEQALKQIENEIAEEVRAWAATGGRGQSPARRRGAELVEARAAVDAVKLEASALAPMAEALESDVARHQSMIRLPLLARTPETVYAVIIEDAEAVASELADAEAKVAKLRASLTAARQAAAVPIFGGGHIHNIASAAIQKILDRSPAQPTEHDVAHARRAWDQLLRSLSSDPAARLELE